jgi:tetratricopeptide (TPR) repeat protein
VLRLLGFFVLAVFLASLLGHVPIVGPVFRHTGILGILLAAALLSAVFARIGERLIVARKLRSELRTRAEVGSAHNHGKIGALYVTHGRPQKALAHLEEAVRGEPDVAEWHYRLGLARLSLRDAAGALAALDGCLALDDEHAYGAAQMRRAECLQRLGRAQEALDALALFERNHGPSPEAAFRRGKALRSLGRAAEARASFAEVAELARRATRYQRKSAGLWALRASVARFL